MEEEHNWKYKTVSLTKHFAIINSKYDFSNLNHDLVNTMLKQNMNIAVIYDWQNMTVFMVYEDVCICDLMIVKYGFIISKKI